MSSITTTPAASEPLRVTLLRTVPLALIIGSAITLIGAGLPSHFIEWWMWAGRIVTVLWFTFGGHWVEVAFLQCVSPILIQQGRSRLSQFAVRVLVWGVGGAVLGIGAMFSWKLILRMGVNMGSSNDIGWFSLPTGRELWTSSLLGAIAFVLIECIVHGIFTALGRPSAWRPRDGRIG